MACSFGSEGRGRGGIGGSTGVLCRCWAAEGAQFRSMVRESLGIGIGGCHRDETGLWPAEAGGGAVEQASRFYLVRRLSIGRRGLGSTVPAGGARVGADVENPVGRCMGFGKRAVLMKVAVAMGFVQNGPRGLREVVLESRSTVSRCSVSDIPEWVLGGMAMCEVIQAPGSWRDSSTRG